MKLPRGVHLENIGKLLSDAVPVPRDALIAYWSRVHGLALPYLARRPLRLVRHVAPITFYHKRTLPKIPKAVHQLTIKRREGGMSKRVWIDNLAVLIGLIEMDVVEIHPCTPPSTMWSGPITWRSI